MTHLLIDILRNSILITGLVTVMMMLIESLELETKNAFFTSLKKSKFGEIPKLKILRVAIFYQLLTAVTLINSIKH